MDLKTPVTRDTFIRANRQQTGLKDVPGFT
jgi:hypothetical protein